MDKLKVVIILLLLMHIATGINGMECNGMEGLCDLRIDQVTFPAAHNAGSDPNVAGECLWRNQNYDPLNQFIRGIRFFDFDTCWHEDKVKHCHSNEYFGCAYGADMSTTLVNFDNVMKYDWSLFGFDFRYEVIILYFNRDADISGETAKEKIGKSLDEILTNLWDPDGNGLLKMNNYYKNNNNQWPTLRQAIKSKQRVFIWMENGPAKYITPQPDWLVQSNGIFTTTGSTIYIWLWITSGHCTGIVSAARSKCATSRDFVDLSSTATFGRCIESMAWYCSKDEAIGAAIDACYPEREKRGKTINILSADYAVNREGYEKLSVVDRAKTMNEKNIQRLIHKIKQEA